MLRLILDRGADFAIPTESMFIGDFASIRKAGGLDDRQKAQRFMERVWNHPKVLLWNLPGAVPEVPEGLSHDEAYRFCVEAPYRAFARQDGKERWGDKTPYYLGWIDEIKAVWPGARIIEIVRDGRDVGLSIMKVPFGANNTYVAARDWAEGIDLGRRAAARYPSDVFTVRYEDLTAEPEQHVRRMCDFLRIPFTEEMLAVEKTSEKKLVADQKDWFTNVWAGINQKSVGKWRREMSPAQQRLFAAVAEEQLRFHGYELGEHAVAGARVGAGRRAMHTATNYSKRIVNLVRLRLIQERGRELRYVIRRRLRRS
jgi:hypothetical protein